MIDDIDGPRLARYVSGQCSAEEAAAVRRWMDSDPERSRFVAELEGAWKAAAQAPYEWGVDEGWRALRDAQEARNREARNRAPIRLVRFAATSDSVFPVRRVAAVILAVVGSCAGMTWWLTAQRQDRERRADAEAMTEVATLRGQRATLRLADGTRVALGMASKLRYARTFGDAGRDVYLDGDGYFEVAHDSAHPFAVHTAQAVVRDVGTKFGVSAYQTSPATEVVVTEGAVTFAGEHTTEPVLLKAADLGRLDRNGQLTTTHGVAAAGYLAWTDGRLVFQDTPLREVIAELGRWYDLDLSVPVADSTIGARRLTASFVNESLPLVVERIALSLDLRVERHGKAIVLRPRHH